MTDSLLTHHLINLSVKVLFITSSRTVNDDGYTQTQHVATTTDLESSTQYWYKVGDAVMGLSNTSYFTSVSAQDFLGAQLRFGI